MRPTGRQNCKHMKNRYLFLSGACLLAVLLSGCELDRYPTEMKGKTESDAKYVGQAVGNFEASEWYPGGELGTTENVTEGCYEDETPSVLAQGLETEFNLGEAAFERKFTQNTETSLLE